MVLGFLTAVLLLAGVVNSDSFKDEQQKYPRVRAARTHTEAVRDSLFNIAGIKYPPEEIFVRIFKHEEEVELWARNDDKSPFAHIKTYPFTANSGVLGPKRSEGDLQIPEGFYVLDWFNPASSYLLSIRINYPNKSDWKRKTGDHPGGSIFIHGNQVTIGCVPIGNEAIEEFYIIAVDSRNEGLERIPTHIFPSRMDTDDGLRVMERYINRDPGLKSFWNELRPGYDYFEQHHRLPDIRIDEGGRYLISAP
jgi:murein L,D-transpeptidase YafK